MNITHDQFIGIYENLITQDYCKELISKFESLSDAGFSVDRITHDGVSNTYQDDDSIFCTQISVEDMKCMQVFFGALWECAYPDYAEKYSILKLAEKHWTYEAKMQRTKVGQGFHQWHFESASRDSSKRLLTWLLYLNDVDDGGETEFLYLHKRVKPKAGTLVIFPAGFTHTHRGNPPLANTKYTITGWIEF